jgi:hypothetical protein
MSPAVFRLANIMAHIDASDREIRQVNATLPQGRMPLLSAMGRATPAIAFLFDELLVRDAFLAIAGAPDRYQLKPVIIRGSKKSQPLAPAAAGVEGRGCLPQPGKSLLDQ